MSVSAYNNLVECLIKREGPTIFHIGKVQYIFAPRPEITGDMEASVCVVISQEHRDYLLKDRMCANYYRQYVPTKKVEGVAEALERAEFMEWQRLRKTMTQEELLEMVAVKTPAQEPEHVFEQSVPAPKVDGRRKQQPAGNVEGLNPAGPGSSPLGAKPEPPVAGKDGEIF
jgi:hypothetical protein